MARESGTGRPCGGTYTHINTCIHTYIDEAVDYVDDESTFIITCKCTSQNVGGIVGFGFLFQWGRSRESIPHTCT